MTLVVTIYFRAPDSNRSDSVPAPWILCCYSTDLDHRSERIVAVDIELQQIAMGLAGLGFVDLVIDTHACVLVHVYVYMSLYDLL